MRFPFRVAPLLASLLGVSATALAADPPPPVAAVVPAQALDAHTPVERSFEQPGTHAYTIDLQAGQFLDAAVNQRGVDLVVRVFAPDGSRLAEIDSPNGAQGDEPIAFEAKASGAYRIEVSPLGQGDAAKGRYQVRIDDILSPQAYAQRLADLRQKQRAVVARLAEAAIPIKTVEAGNGFADLQPLKRVFKDVRYLGLGEETHGTREFFQFKHRLLEFLVEQMGFRVFAIEASYAGCQDINDYVMGRTSDGAKALDSQGFWTWNTEEVRALLDWMRAYNARVPADRRVEFVGFDIQKNDSGKAHLLEYLRRVAPTRVEEASALFATNEDAPANALFDSSGQDKKAQAQLDELRSRYDQLFVFLELNGTQLAARSSQAEYEQMREYARVLAQYIDVYSHLDTSTRDLYMADNFRRIVAREPAGTRIAIWAHNGHIAFADGEGARPTFGQQMRRSYGKAYYALGMSFNRGSFQSRDLGSEDPNDARLRSFTVGPAPEDSVDWYLGQAGTSMFIVDFRSRHPGKELDEWLAAPRLMRSIGSGFAADSERNFFASLKPGGEFDGLFFIDTTSRARPNPSVTNVDR